MSGRFENRVVLVTGGDSLADVGIGRDLCLQRGIPIGIDLGCHMNDHMVSFYLANPSQFAVEYGWGDGTLR